MKKISILFAAACIGVLSFSSCKKDYHCQCTYNSVVVYDQDLGKMSKSDATNQCNTKSTSVAGQTWGCAVK